MIYIVFVKSTHCFAQNHYLHHEIWLFTFVFWWCEPHSREEKTYTWCPFGLDWKLYLHLFFHVSFFFSFLFFFSAATFDFSIVNSAPVHCSRVSQITFFSNFFIKNWSHNTIYILIKNYFTTVFLILAKISCIQMNSWY